VHIWEISVVSFCLSFLFALGGLGSAAALIPALVFLGVPFPVARPAGLFTNFVTTLSATYYNFRKNLIDFSLALPVFLTSVLASPLGAYASTLVSEQVVGIIFTLFLFFAGIMIYTPKGKLFDAPKFYPYLVGLIAGFFSGLLGIGGGAIMSPMLVIAGYNPKRVAPVTAFAVVFSSLSGFLAYWKLGKVDWGVTLAAAIPALFAGYLGALVTHRFLSAAQVKKILGAIFFILGIKFLLKFI
jgi:uncharacterized membrane protein YfcA